MRYSKQKIILESMLNNIERDITQHLKAGNSLVNKTISVELIAFYAKTMEKYINLSNE